MWRPLCVLASMFLSLLAGSPVAVADHGGQGHVWRAELVTTALDGTQANRHSGQPAISGDGRVVAFSSDAFNLVPGDGNDASDVFVYDEATGDIERVSVATDGSEAEGSSGWPAISGDGRIVAFTSEARNLVPQDRNHENDTFAHDRTTGRTELVSVADDGIRALGGSQTPSVSGDGRYVAFDFLNDVVVRDRVRGRTELASVANDGSPAECCSLNPAISADGRIVAFEAYAKLVPRDTNDVTDVYVRDLERARTEMVSVASDGGQANRESGSPSVSGDGRIVAFTSFADNLVPRDSNYAGDVFARDRVSGRTERVSVTSDGFQSHAGSHAPAVSGDGRLIAFASWADNLVFRDGNNAEDVFVHDRLAARTEIVSVARGGASGDGGSASPTVSSDGRLIAFGSRAANLVPDDRNRRHDVLVARRVPSQRPRCTITGTHGDDVLIGTGADDVVCGRGGNDRLIGRGGDDVLRGGAGRDLLKGGAGADLLFGGRGGDELLGGAGGDAVFGGSGGDRLGGGPGDDKLEGGAGSDRLLGGAASDLIRGGRGSDRLWGGPGDDRLWGGAGQDVCRGGLGTDRTSRCEQDPPRCFGMRPTIVGTGGPDVLTGTAGDDVIVGLDGLDVIDGGEGDDRICAGEDPVDTQGVWESVYGGPGADRIKGGRGQDALYGGDGADIVFGGANPSFGEEDGIQEAEYISGGKGNDTLVGGPGVDVVFGGAGADRLSSGDDRGAASYGGGHPDNYLYGGDGRDQLSGGSGIEHAQGGNGSDRLEGGADDDSLHGGCSYLGYGHPHDVPELGEEAPNPTCADTHGRDKVLGGAGSDRLDGGGGRDLLRGHDGDDRIAGGAGDDDLDGGPGRNLNHGGSGTDRCANPSRGANAIACENSP